MPNQPGRLYQGVDALLFALTNCHGLMGVKKQLCLFMSLSCCRYCKRNAFSPMISTTGRHLTIVYKSKNLNRRSMTYWWIRIPQPLIYGFSASYSSREFDSKYLSLSLFVSFPPSFQSLCLSLALRPGVTMWSSQDVKIHLAVMNYTSRVHGRCIRRLSVLVVFRSTG